jgi:hypothetical protein
LARNGSGIYSLPPGNPVVTNTTISSSWANTTLSDIGSAITQSISKDGQTVATGNLPMGGFRHTNVSAATQANEYARLDQVQSGSYSQLSISGTNTIVATGAPPVTSYVTGAKYSFIAAGDNTMQATLNIDSLGAIPITKYGNDPLSPGDLVSGGEAFVIYDGTNFQLINPATIPLTQDLVVPYMLDKSTQGFAMVNGKLDVSVSGNALTIAIKTINSGISAITGLVGGTGYTEPPLISFTGGGGTGAQAIATVNAGSVTAITITNPGKNFTSVPTVVLTGGGGTGASATAVISNPSTLDPVIVTLRSATDSSGAVDVVKITSATSITVPDTATLGTVNATLSRIWVSLFNNSGTAVLGVTNISGDYIYGDDIIASGTAISTASDNVNVNYTSTGITSKAMRVLGYIESTQATAGTWATAPSRVANESAVYYQSLVKPTITLGTVIATTSGTNVDITGIPAGTKRVTLMFSGVNLNGSSPVIIQLGTSGSFETTGYVSTGSGMSSTVTTNSYTAGFGISNGGAFGPTFFTTGSIVFNLLNESTNTWVESGMLTSTGPTGTNISAGSKSLSGVITRIRITTIAGTDVFAAGSVNILLE